MNRKTAVEQELSQLKGKMFADCGQSENWDTAIGISPRKFYNILSANLPDDIYIYIELKGRDMGEFTMRSDQIFAECKFSRMHKRLYLEEVKVEQKRQGMGKTFLANCLSLSAEWGVETIELRAGREDGAYFWSRRAATLEDSPVLKERFQNQVRENANALELQPEFRAKIDEILSTNDARMNFNLASLAQPINGKPAGVALLKGTNPRLQFHLDDQNQMELVKAGLN